MPEGVVLSKRRFEVPGARRRGTRGFGFVTAVVLLSSLTSLVGAQSLPDIEVPALSQGLFSSVQVERGEQSYSNECLECHEMEEFTAPDAFLDEQQGESVWSVFEFIWSEMPEDKPAWLDPEEYADILAYILSVYGFPTGMADMPIERRVLERVVIEPPPRPGS